MRTAVVLALLLIAAAFQPVLAGQVVTISQQGRAFNPGTIALAAGDTLRIVNDDEDLLHHAYLKNPLFSFDSGDQEPGSSTDVVFPVAGEFDVMCGIHPKMKLHVSVK